MGSLTAAQIISEGQLLAGRDDMETQALGYLNRWLDGVAASWPWPILQTEAMNVPVTAGLNEVQFGNGNNVSHRVMKILDNVWAYSTDRTKRARVRIRHQLSSPVDRIAPTTNVGFPLTARIFADVDGFGLWGIVLEPLPDQAYYLTVPYLIIPAQITLTSEVPWYMNDDTMIYAVALRVSEYHNGMDHPVTQSFQQKLAGLVSLDRVRYGSITGVNDNLVLSAGRWKQKDNTR